MRLRSVALALPQAQAAAEFLQNPWGLIAAGTRGAALVSGARTIKIHGEHVPVHAEVANLTMLSAHADSDELMRWLGAMQAAPLPVTC